MHFNKDVMNNARPKVQLRFNIKSARFHGEKRVTINLLNVCFFCVFFFSSSSFLLSLFYQSNKLSFCFQVQINVRNIYIKPCSHISGPILRPTFELFLSVEHATILLFQHLRARSSSQGKLKYSVGKQCVKLLFSKWRETYYNFILLQNEVILNQSDTTWLLIKEVSTKRKHTPEFTTAEKNPRHSFHSAYTLFAVGFFSSFLPKFHHCEYTMYGSDRTYLDN